MFTTTESTGSTTRTSSTPADKVSHNIASPTGRKYIAFFSADINVANLATRCKVDLLVDGVVVQTYSPRFYKTGEWHNTFSFEQITGKTASFDIKIQFSSTDNTNTVTIKNARIVVWDYTDKESTLDLQYGADNTGRALPAAFDSNGAGVSFTPPTTGNYFILGSGGIAPGSTSVSAIMELLVESTELPLATDTTAFLARESPSNVTDAFYNFNIATRQSLASGAARTIRVRARNESGTTGTWKHTRVLAFREDAFVSSNFAQADNASEYNHGQSTSYSTRATVTTTAPSAAKDYLILAGSFGGNRYDTFEDEHTEVTVTVAAAEVQEMEMSSKEASGPADYLAIGHASVRNDSAAFTVLTRVRAQGATTDNDVVTKNSWIIILRDEGQPLISKSLQYTVKTTPTAPSKSLRYDIDTPVIPHHIDLIQANWSTTNISFSNIYGIYRHESANFDGNLKAYLQVTLITNNASYAVSAQLYDLTAAAAVPDTILSTTGTTWQTLQSTTDIADHLIDGHDYIIQIKVANAAATGNCMGGRIILRHKTAASPSAIVEFQPIAVANSVTGAGSDTYATPALTPRIMYEGNQYDGTLATYFEATLYTSGNTVNDITYARLYDVTSGAAVTGSEISITGNNGTVQRARSGAITLTDGHEYVVQIKQAITTDTAYIYSGHLMYKQTGSISKTQLHQLVNSIEGSTTSTTFAYFYAGMRFNKAMFRKLISTAAYFEANIKTNNASGIATANLYDLTNTTTISGDISTSSLSYVRQRSATFDILTATSDQDDLKQQLKTNNASYTSYMMASRVIINVQLTGVTSNSITKSLKYVVKITPSALTKSLKYTIKITPAALTKSLGYSIKLVTAITRSLKYTTKITPSALTKSLKYTTKITPSVLTKSLTYTIKKGIAITKSLQYTVKSTPSALTKSLQYIVKAPHSLTKSLQYVIQTAVQVNIQKSLKYTVKTVPSAITKSLKYTVKTTISTITKSLKYTVKIVPGAITKSLKYDIKLPTVNIQKSLKYTIRTIPAAITKSLKYAVKITPSTLTKSLQYIVKAPHAITKSLKYTTKITQAALTKSLKYTIKITPAAITKLLSYGVRVNTAITKSLQYTIKKGISITKSLQYTVKEPQALTKSLKYTIKVAPSAINKSLKYVIRTAVAITKSLRYVITEELNGGGGFGGFEFGSIGFGEHAPEIGAVIPRVITKSLQYAVKTIPSALTKALKYDIKLPTINIQKVLAYTIKITPSALTKQLKYTVKTTQSAITKTLEYTIKITVSAITKSLRYTVTITPGAITKSLQYIVAVPVIIQKSLRYVLSTEYGTKVIQKTLKYCVKAPVQYIEKLLSYLVLVNGYVEKYFPQGTEYDEKYTTQGNTHAEKYTEQGTVYTEKNTEQGNTYTEKYTPQGNTYTDKY